MSITAALLSKLEKGTPASGLPHAGCQILSLGLCEDCAVVYFLTFGQMKVLVILEFPFVDAHNSAQGVVVD